MTDKYQLVYDQSTSGTKLLLLLEGKIIKRLDKKHEQCFPEDGWVEHDPVEIIENVEKLFNEMLTAMELHPADISSVSVTNQRETIVAWDKTTGRPVTRALVWQDNRSAELCETIYSDERSSLIRCKTGLRLDPYFSGSKIKWLFDHFPEMKTLSDEQRLAIGTMDSWLIWNMTQRKTFATEPSNACRTLLYNIQENYWDCELLEIFGVSLSDLPEIYHSSDCFGKFHGIPVKGVMADSQAALFGQNVIEAGDVKITLGTGSSILMRLDQDYRDNDSRILTTVAGVDKEKITYVLEGIIRSCADSINWFNEKIAHFTDIENSCNQVLQNQESRNIFFLPALEGLGTPFWNNQATGVFIGMKRSTSRADLLAAILESIIFQVKLVLDVMEEVSGSSPHQLRVDGGVTKNRYLMQLLAALCEKEVWVSGVEELSAIGVVAYSFPDQKLQNQYEVYLPNKEKQQFIQNKYSEWRRLSAILEKVK
ncbi:FGGY-family carbohydrate kinase [Lactovum odontotermitis]